MASVNSAFGTVTSAPLQRAPVHSLTELQNSYLPAHFQSQHLSVSTTPVSTPESRNSDGSRVNDSGGSPTTISPDGISHNFGLGRKTYIPVYRSEILLKYRLRCTLSLIVLFIQTHIMGRPVQFKILLQL